MSSNIVKDLVSRFSDHQSEYTSGVYNVRGQGARDRGLGAGGWISEFSHSLTPNPKPLTPAPNRRDFLDPLFESLAWEKRGLAQAERSGDVPVPAFPVGRRI